MGDGCYMACHGIIVLSAEASEMRMSGRSVCNYY
jgi:hypothetical protein